AIVAGSLIANKEPPFGHRPRRSGNEVADDPQQYGPGMDDHIAIDIEVAPYRQQRRRYQQRDGRKYPLLERHQADEQHRFDDQQQPKPKRADSERFRQVSGKMLSQHDNGGQPQRHQQYRNENEKAFRFLGHGRSSTKLANNERLLPRSG